ncbi:MAG TPA: pyridoxal-dependent decarboxylase [Gemmatimonadales bacterium]|nr:pyridoxal-dependent decarboxylase [Gemmatimonadales bacterium]
MQPDEFRRHAHQLVDWMADYFATAGDLPITPEIKPGDVISRLPSAAPEQGEAFERLFADFQSIILPGMSLWNHPGWFAYFPGNTSPPSVLAEMLTATLNPQCMSWATSPAATELEQVVMEWLRQMVGLPQGFVGSIQDTASTATLLALLSARERASGFAAGVRGLGRTGARLTVYSSTEAHSSVDKAVKLAGYGLDQLRRIPVQHEYAMRTEALVEAITRDVAAGCVPACVIATVGSTSSTAIDPLPAIAAVCRRHGVWLHVDAAYAGTAAIVPELRHLFSGMEQADSLVFNPHKWMLINLHCTAYFVRDRETLLRTFQATPEYLRTAQDAEVTNYRDWGIQLGRRFRALKVWFVIRSYGLENLRKMVRAHVGLAQELASWIEESENFELMAPVPFGLVCFRYRPASLAADHPLVDRLNEEILQRVNATRRVHLTHTRLGGRYAIRLVIGQRQTERSHVEGAWRSIQEAGRKLVEMAEKAEP